eukprot:2513718-Rhodomonas_salina.1
MARSDPAPLEPLLRHAPRHRRRHLRSPSPSIYGCIAAVYGCNAPIYGCDAAIYGCRAAVVFLAGLCMELALRCAARYCARVWCYEMRGTGLAYGAACYSQSVRCYVTC